MRLKCTKFEFDTDEIAEVNFFNRDVTITQIAEVDLYDYLILDSMKDNSYKAPNVDEQTQAYYYEANGVQFDVSGAKDNNYLLEFFEIFSTAINFKWILSQYDEDGNLIFISFISKEDLKVPVIEERVINVQSISYDLEFSTWYAQEPLASITDLWTGAPYIVNPAEFLSANITDVLNRIFDAPNSLFRIQCDSDIAQWRVAKIPYFYLPHTDFVGNQITVLSGYDNFVQQQLNKLEYFNSLCKSMGWKWFFRNGVLYVKNLYATEGDVIQIDYESTVRGGVIETGIENTFLNLKIDNVILPNGFINGGSDSTVNIAYGVPQQNFNVGGDRKVVFSDTAYNNNKMTRGRYTLVGTSSSSGYGYAGVLGINYNFLRYKDNELNLYRFDYIRENGVGVEPDSNLYNFVENRTLIIDVACNTDRTMRIDMGNTRFNSAESGIFNGQFLANANDPFETATDLQFCGNAGSALFRFDFPMNKYVTYEWYKDHSEVFENNFSTYLGSDLLQLVTVKGDGLQTNPLNRYQIVNFPLELTDFFEGKIFNMQFLGFNQFEQTFELKLIVK